MNAEISLIPIKTVKITLIPRIKTVQNHWYFQNSFSIILDIHTQTQKQEEDEEGKIKKTEREREREMWLVAKDFGKGFKFLDFKQGVYIYI